VACKSDTPATLFEVCGGTFLPALLAVRLLEIDDAAPLLPADVDDGRELVPPSFLIFCKRQ
jgi:hypothetical protein